MMKKVSIKILKYFLILCIIIMTIIVTLSCSAYDKVIDSASIEDKIKEIQKEDNYTKLEDIDETFLNAIVAIEDHRFYKHGAIDILSIGRALLTNIKNGEIVEGGSTITQQLAKNLFLNGEQTFKRKVEEIFIANKLEKEYSKDDILELYVNVIYYGDGFTGIKEASDGYFSKAPNELTYDEATLLAGLPQAPSAYSLSENYEEASERQEAVIEALSQWTR